MKKANKIFSMQIDKDSYLSGGDLAVNQEKRDPSTLSDADFLPASEEEKEYMVQMRPSTTFFRDGVKRLAKNRVALVSFIVIVVITLSAVILPMFWPYTYEDMLGVQPGKPVDASYNNLAPMTYGKTEQAKIEAGEKVFPHLFGTDSSGRDYFIRVVYGTRISLAVGFFASIIVLIIGITIGSIAGYIGGKVDLVIMRIVDIIYSLPDMLMVILLASVLRMTLATALEGTVLEKIGSNIISLFIVFGVLYWVSMSRLIRGQILSLREQEYVLAAQATGACYVKLAAYTDRTVKYATTAPNGTTFTASVQLKTIRSNVLRYPASVKASRVSCFSVSNPFFKRSLSNLSVVRTGS